MSRTETHIGKAKLMTIDKPIEDWAKELANQNGYQELPSYYSSYKELLIDKFRNKYLILSDRVYQILENYEGEEGEDICHGTIDGNGVISYTLQFYNGGTYFGEMFEFLLNKITPSKINQQEDVTTLDPLAIYKLLVQKYDELELLYAIKIAPIDTKELTWKGWKRVSELRAEINELKKELK